MGFSLAIVSIFHGRVRRSAAKQTDIGKRIDDALVVIETENPKLKGILDKRYARAQLPDSMRLTL